VTYELDGLEVQLTVRGGGGRAALRCEMTSGEHNREVLRRRILGRVRARVP